VPLENVVHLSRPRSLSTGCICLPVYVVVSRTAKFAFCGSHCGTGDLRKRRADSKFKEFVIYRRKLTASYSDDASCPDMLLTVACVKRRLTEGMSESDALLRRWSERLADDFDIRTCLIDTVLQLHQPCSNARNLPEIMDPPFRRVRQKGSPFVLSTSVDNLHVKR